MSDSAKEIILTGIGVSQGIVIGSAYLVQIELPGIPEYVLPSDQTEAEVTRFDQAVFQAKDEISEMKNKSDGLSAMAAEDISFLLDAHLAMLSGSRLIRGVRNKIVQEGINAEWAVGQEVALIAEQFRQIKDQYIAARCDDVFAVGHRLIRILMNVPYMSLGDVPKGGIVLAREISPAEISLLGPRKLSGIATVYGGVAGHTAVMARSMGIPAVLGLSPTVLESKYHGAMVIVDGVGGKLVLNPTPATRRIYAQKLQRLRQDRRELQKLAQLPALTADGVEIVLRANLEM
ncbi:MAG: phosphoenolpyruvate--protein phosphotransferase, partial [Alphaproteobacteria bacterium]|nr:phosphoenolpyruvate--protein phosphotransferase [Alphaproteobacteria bacterium]